MTREEAIRELSYIADEMPSMECGDWKEAICIAIEALEQQPCEDAISRQAALDCFTATKLKKFDFILYAREEIKKLPPVIPQSNTGHWIDEFGGCECSKCGCLEAGHSDFCPNCGVRMVDPHKSEEENEK